jgi:predicted GNAT family acetyltransferase
METYELINNIKKRQYEFHIDEKIARIEYTINAIGDVYLTHTQVPDSLAGQGIAAALTEKVLLDIQQRGVNVIPLCPFIIAYIRRHPEWKTLVLPGVSI